VSATALLSQLNACVVVVPPEFAITVALAFQLELELRSVATHVGAANHGIGKVSVKVPEAVSPAPAVLNWTKILDELTEPLETHVPVAPIPVAAQVGINPLVTPAFVTLSFVG